MGQELLAQRLREQMGKKGVRPAELAALCGISLPSVYDWMRRGCIAKHHLPRLAVFFGVDVSYWLGRPDADDPPPDLTVDPERIEPGPGESTDIYVRACLNGKWGTWDISCLDRESLIRWLRMGTPTRAEETVALLLGHRVD